MSVILAGTCRQCKAPYWISLGHPQWFKDWLRTKVKTRKIELYESLRSEKLCLSCAPEKYRELFEPGGGTETKSSKRGSADDEGTV